MVVVVPIWVRLAIPVYPGKQPTSVAVAGCARRGMKRKRGSGDGQHCSSDRRGGGEPNVDGRQKGKRVTSTSCSLKCRPTQRNVLKKTKGQTNGSVQVTA